MGSENFGIWAMLAFWASAIGGIAFAITWAKSRGRDGANSAVIRKSLKRRLDRGELTQEQYDQRIAELDH